MPNYEEKLLLQPASPPLQSGTEWVVHRFHSEVGAPPHRGLWLTVPAHRVVGGPGKGVLLGALAAAAQLLSPDSVLLEAER